MRKVFLDAFVKKDDFNAEFNDGTRSQSMKSTISISELEKDSFFLNALRKPDFQRETNDWDEDKIVEFIDSLVSNELIPSIILWKNENNLIFLIDGAHRISAVCAWINDDYGDGEISRSYYDGYIPDEQIKIAASVREKINSVIGPYSSYKDKSISKRGIDFEKKLNNLGSIGISIQWVFGDSRKAEESFVKINQKSTPISDRELEIITNRDESYAACTRLILRAAKGHDYISNIKNPNEKIEITKLAKEVHLLMFGKKSVNYTDLNNLPIAGMLSSCHTLDIIAQTVVICNNDNEKLLKSEITFNNLKKILINCKKTLSYIFSNEQYSLGLHPYIYFYNDIGGHKIGNYYGILQFISDVKDKPNELNKYIRNRERLERIIMKYGFVFQQLQRKWRQSKRAYKELARFYSDLLDEIDNNIDDIVVINEISAKYNFLDFKIIDNEIINKKASFSQGKKKQIKIQSMASTLLKCPICNGYLSPNSSSIDHIQRKEDNGDNSIANGQLTHLYCNTTYKEKLVKEKELEVIG